VKELARLVDDLLNLLNLHVHLLQVIVRRGEPIPAEPSGPIIVCTRNDDLPGVVEATPPSRRPGLHPSKPLPVQEQAFLFCLCY
jgi:hypothetical protein